MTSSSRWGSSPLARGLHRRRGGPLRLRRIIPARAGFTGWATPPPWAPWDHPRSRGVYCLASTRARLSMGSSPLARGLRPPPVGDGRDGRIIPARAGFTSSRSASESLSSDHPRSRGVYHRRHLHPPKVTGSSPLARGLPDLALLSRRQHGIIPARAGFTRSMMVPFRVGWDHPRSRGVYISTPTARRPMSGSSPLARGLLRECGPFVFSSRIIPARAGFTRFCDCAHALFLDHPRSRGVYFDSMKNAVSKTGSSPLARGLP